MPSTPNAPITGTSRTIAVGDIVALRSTPDKIGAVTQVLPGTPEYRYVVFIDQRTTTFYASQLNVQQSVLDAPTAPPDVLSLKDFQARLTALQLLQPSLSNLYSLHAARVNFVPYQFRPVLKFIRADRPRLLIADEVGVGKTIEAGLILRELQARQEVRSVLIICPRPLVKERKWYLEMKRFDEEFTALEGTTLRHCLSETDYNGVWPQQYAKCIVPFSLFDERLLHGNGARRGRTRQLGLLDLDTPPHFDLVIVDECHALRNPNTSLHQGVRHFIDGADAAVFLSATPIQLGNSDLWVLLNLLRPDVILDRETFNQMSEPNPFLHRVIAAARGAERDWEQDALQALSDVAKTAWGRAVTATRPEYQQVCRTLEATTNNKGLDARDRLQIIRDTENLYSFAHLINRTRRRDIGNFTTRKPETVEVDFTLPQRQLHDALLCVQERILRACHGDRPMQFLMTMLRRQAASCLFGLAPLVETILSRRMDNIDLDDPGDEGELELSEANFQSLADAIASVVDMAKRLDPATDPKRDALLALIRGKQERENNKLLLFSSFRHTLRYLLRHLQSASVRVGLIQGDVADEERSLLRERFRRPKSDALALDILLSSEVGCEGLDYEFCDALVNYDIPWNPQKVEQRIGRIDRYGQQSETVAIYNFVTPDTVDFEIYTRCLERIGVFRAALGASEEILGRITQSIKSAAENLTLTEDERAARLQQIADNEIRLLQEETELEEKQAQLFGIVPIQQTDEVKDATSRYLTPSALENLVTTYLDETIGGEGHLQSVQGDAQMRWLRLSQDARSRLLEDFKKLPRQTGATVREWELWLKGAEQRLEVTFYSEAAARRRGSTFITPIHPLAQQAANGFATEPRPFYTALRVSIHDAASCGDITPGAYPFAIFEWQRRGVRDDALLQPVCTDGVLMEQFMNVIECARPVNANEAVVLPDSASYEELETKHYALWVAARARHQEETTRMVDFRRESLRISFEGRVKLLKEQQLAAQDAKIARMRNAQIVSARADYERRLTEVEKAQERADIHTEAVAYGVLIMEQ